MGQGRPPGHVAGRRQTGKRCPASRSARRRLLFAGHCGRCHGRRRPRAPSREVRRAIAVALPHHGRSMAAQQVTTAPAGATRPSARPASMGQGARTASSIHTNPIHHQPIHTTPPTTTPHHHPSNHHPSNHHPSNHHPSNHHPANPTRQPPPLQPPPLQPPPLQPHHPSNHHPSNLEPLQPSSRTSHVRHSRANQAL